MTFPNTSFRSMAGLESDEPEFRRVSQRELEIYYSSLNRPAGVGGLMAYVDYEHCPGCDGKVIYTANTRAQGPRPVSEYQELAAFLTARLDEDERYLKSNQHHLWTQRPLREVEAKRAIVRRCAGVMNEMDQYPNGLVSPRALLARQTLMWLAAIWSDHPDYREEWGAFQ